MLLGVISIVSFEFWGDFWRKTQKGETGKSGIFGFLHCSIGNPRHGVALHRGEARVPKWHPLGYATA